MDKVRVAMIGCGGISRAHVNGHMSEPRSELAYCVDINEDLAKEKAEAAGCKWHTDMEAVLDDVDAVDICTPVHLHAEQTIIAAEAGKHVLCEKIMARDLHEAESMIEATDKAGVIFMVAFVLRYRPEFQMLHDMCMNDDFGLIHQGFCSTTMFMDPAHVRPWRTTVEQFPMGALMSHGCHYVDQLQWDMGTITEALAIGNRFTLGDVIPGGDDTECMVMRHENGAVSAYVESWATPHRMQGIRLEIFGKKASARLVYNNDGTRQLWKSDESGMNVVWEYDPAKEDHMDVFGGAKDMQGQISHFIECILDGKQPMTHGREGIRPMQAIAAATEGGEQGVLMNVADYVAQQKK
jgi:predicted dehydrogenase